MVGEIISFNQKGKRLVWATINGTVNFCQMMQFFIDASNDAGFIKDFLFVKDNGICYDAYRLAKEVYGVRKRTFKERMDNVITYTI